MKQTLVDIISHSRWRKLFWIILLFLIIFIFFFRYKISYNEMDVIPYALSVYLREWIPSDWYLNQSIPYRYFFSYPAGFLVDKFGFLQAIFIGRIISYLLISYALFSLIEALSSKRKYVVYILTITIQFYFFSYGIGAGEWMVGGFDTKVFAYGFVLLSFASFLSGHIKRGWFCAGLALSLHALIGTYHIFCLLPSIILFQNRAAKRELLKSFPLFLLGGIFGIYSIYQYLLEMSSGLQTTGYDIYVNISVAHHVMPDHFPSITWIYLFCFSVLNIFLIRSHQSSVQKRISIYALASVIFILIGLILFFLMGSTHLLRYYFFRFGDVMLPLMTLLSIAAIVEKLNFNQRLFKFGSILFMVLLIAPKVKYRLIQLTLNKEKILSRTSVDFEMEAWINSNTKKSQVIITNPDDIYFYINCQRSAFVLLRQSPQSGKELTEWYKRLKALNGGNDFETKEEVIQNYMRLTETNVLGIVDVYPEVSFVLMPKSKKMNLPIHFETDKSILYSVSENLIK